MFDVRPVLHLFGLILIVLGGAMLIPMGLDLSDGNANWHSFFESAIATILVGGFLALSSQGGSVKGYPRKIKQLFCKICKCA